MPTNLQLAPPDLASSSQGITTRSTPAENAAAQNAAAQNAAAQNAGAQNAAALPDEALEQLALMVRGVTRELDADGVVVAWHDGGEPLFLFAEGQTGSPDNGDRAAIESATMAAQRTGVPQSRWQREDDGEPDDLLTTSIPADGGVITLTTRFTRIGGVARQRVRNTATRLMPLIQPFFELWALRLRTMAKLRGLTAALNHSDVGVLLVDRRGQLLFVNAPAEALLVRQDGLRRAGGTLGGCKLTDTLRLQAAIEHVVEQGAAASPCQSVVAVRRESGRPLMVAVMASESPARSIEDSAAVIYVFDPDRDLRPLVEPVCKLYELTPMETRLACLLADGVSLADAAEQMRLREQTARSYLKQVFLKTDTNRQAELVWLMLKSAIGTTTHQKSSLFTLK